MTNPDADVPHNPAGDPAPLEYALPHEHQPAPDRLSRGDAACLALKIIGIYLFLQALPAIATSFQVSRFDLTSVLTLFAYFVIPAGMGILAFIFSGRLARWMLPRTSVVVSQAPGHAPAQLQAIAFSIVGAYVVATSFPWLVWAIARVLTEHDHYAQVERLHLSIPTFCHYGAETLIGLYLFFGSKRIAAMWWRLRHPELPH